MTAKTKRTKSGAIRGRPSKSRSAKQAARRSPPASKPKSEPLSAKVGKRASKVDVETLFIVRAERIGRRLGVNLDALKSIRRGANGVSLKVWTTELARYIAEQDGGEPNYDLVGRKLRELRRIMRKASDN